MDASDLIQWCDTLIAASEAICERRDGDLIQVAFEQGKIEAYRKVQIKATLPPGFVRPHGQEHGRSEEA